MLRERGCRELVLLTTCNRVEIYGCTEEDLETGDVANCLRVGGELSAGAELRSFYRHEDRDCACHFFRVTSGLDSMVVGETEIVDLREGRRRRNRSGELIADQVEVGQVLCIVEAMKLMNEIESDVAGEIVKRIATSGQPVEYGQPLFAIKPR